MKYNEYLNGSFDPESGDFDNNKAKQNVADRKDRINILLMGASGVGKSALVNSFFGLDIAKTGDGVPQTQYLEKFIYEDKGLVLWDTKGIEAADYQNTLETLRQDLDQASQHAVLHKSVLGLPHIAWLCIKETSKRIEERELELVRLVAEYNIPVIVVFTQTQFESGDAFTQEAKRIFENDPTCHKAIGQRYARVNSVEYTLMGGAVTIPLTGLDQLLYLTEAAFPEAHKNAKLAFEKAQSIDAKKKLSAIINSCKMKIHLAAVASGTAGASPIPGSDAPIIAAIQSTLIYTINAEFELDEETSQSTAIATGVLGVTALAQVGRSVVANVLKFIPGAGSIAGGAISASTAIALTEALGHAYVKTLTIFYDEQEARVILPHSTKRIIDTFTQVFSPVKTKK